MRDIFRLFFRLNEKIADQADFRIFFAEMYEKPDVSHGFYSFYWTFSEKVV